VFNTVANEAATSEALRRTAVGYVASGERRRRLVFNIPP
jgi:hypothetical protein